MRSLPSLSDTTALVTGASSGIGAEFAARLAQRGADLVVVARSTDKLKLLASSLQTAHGVRVHTETLDLSDPRAPQELFERITDRGVEIDYLVNNAASGVVGPAATADPAAVAAMLNVNAQAAVGTTLRFLPAMVSRGSGVIVNVASLGASAPFPFMAAYAGSKALLHSFTMALSAELTGSGVRALSVCPGVTATGQRSEDILPGGLGGIRRPEQVVTTTFRALQTGKASVVDGRRNAALVRLALRHLPERAVLALTRRITEPGLGSK